MYAYVHVIPFDRQLTYKCNPVFTFNDKMRIELITDWVYAFSSSFFQVQTLQ